MALLLPSSRTIDAIHTIATELNDRLTIPRSYQAILEERLVITFTTFTRLGRRVKRRDDRDSRVQHKHKKAQQVYAEVLNESPQNYLPFILAVSPRACQSFDVSRFQQQLGQESRELRVICLNDRAKELLDIMSQRNEFEADHLYRKLIQHLFQRGSFNVFWVVTKLMGKDSVPKPISAAENDALFTFTAIDVNALRDTFGVLVYDLFDDGPERELEKLDLMLQTTECVQVTFAQNEVIDVILRLKIGNANGLVRTLYPRVVLPPAEACAYALTKDNAYFTLKGASVSALRSMFPPKLCEAINSSELRAWEQANYLLDTTDCVILEVSRAEPCCVVIIVRVGYIAGFSILRELCD